MNSYIFKQMDRWIYEVQDMLLAFVSSLTHHFSFSNVSQEKESPSIFYHLSIALQIYLLRVPLPLSC